MVFKSDKQRKGFFGSRGKSRSNAQPTIINSRNSPSQIRNMFKNKAKFRIASGSDSPTGVAVRRLIIETKDNETFKRLKNMENKLENIFDVEIVVFR